MTMRPDFDFQLGKAIRLRGWGPFGLVALTLLLASAVAISPIAAPIEAGILYVIYALKNLF